MGLKIVTNQAEEVANQAEGCHLTSRSLLPRQYCANMAKIEDSPLSITASIAGILTFVAAILAFIYVRYTTLRNGREEITETLESVSATIEDTRTLLAAQTDTPTTHRTGQTDATADNNNNNPLARLMQELYIIELDIMRICVQVYGSDGPFAKAMPEGLDLSGTAALVEAGVQARRYKNRRVSLHQLRAAAMGALAPLLPFSSSVSAIYWFVLGLGQTPILVRWYVVRERVLELVKRRETVRARMLFLNVSAAVG